MVRLVPALSRLGCSGFRTVALTPGSANLSRLSGQPPIITRVASYLNSSELLAVPRLYLYSPDDLLVPADEVEAHAAQAKERGAQVTTVPFPDSAHVSHARSDPVQYWAAIKALWERSTAERA